MCNETADAQWISPSDEQKERVAVLARNAAQDVLRGAAARINEISENELMHLFLKAHQEVRSMGRLADIEFKALNPGKKSDEFGLDERHIVATAFIAVLTGWEEDAPMHPYSGAGLAMLAFYAAMSAMDHQSTLEALLVDASISAYGYDSSAVLAMLAKVIDTGSAA